jgi:hypothetical protein
MSLLLNGAKTLTIAGTEMSCVEIYTGEAYTFPFSFTDSVGNPINCTGWTLAIGAKYYIADTVTYASNTSITLGNLTLSNPQPSTGVGSYAANLTATFTNASTGVGYIYVPSDITGGTGTPNPTPVVTLANSGANTNLVILTLSVSRTDPLSSRTDINREPIGLLVRYQ